jgi:hypothetical protein
VEGIVLTLELTWSLQEGAEDADSVGEELVNGLIVFFLFPFFFFFFFPRLRSLRPHSTPASESLCEKIFSRLWSCRGGALGIGKAKKTSYSERLG